MLKFSASCAFAGYILAIPVADMQAFGFVCFMLPRCYVADFTVDFVYEVLKTIVCSC
jgi:hypothetical protein